MLNYSESQLKKRVEDKSTELGLALKDDSLEGMVITLSFTQTFMHSDKELEDMIRKMVKDEQVGYAMEEGMRKGITVEYTDGVKEVFEKK